MPHPTVTNRMPIEITTSVQKALSLINASGRNLQEIVDVIFSKINFQYILLHSNLNCHMYLPFSDNYH